MLDSARVPGSVLARAGVEVWIADPAALSDTALARCLELLPGEEQARIARFHFERHRREATASRALVRTTLARYVQVSPSSFRYRLGPYGRPFVDPPCGIYFSATNHPGLVACAVCLEEEVGVDVEPLSRGDEILEVRRTVFSVPELGALDALLPAQRQERAVSLWTCKEAYIKARGLGFSAPLQEIAIDFPPAERPKLRLLSATDVAEGWWLEMRDVAGFRIAVAARTRTPEVIIHAWDGS
jgi:4'-phosphopantetheinyl transferase